MAFELIFGQNAVPGSADVYNILLRLKGRQDCERFCQETRINAAGGESASKEQIQQRAIELEKQASDSFAGGNYLEAYNTFYEAVEINGQLSSVDRLITFMSVMIELKRYDEAITFLRHSSESSRSQLESMKAWCYHAMGYQDFVKTQMEKTIAEEDFNLVVPRSFNDSDLEEAMEKVLRFDLSTSNWDQATFLLYHIQLHRQYRQTETETILAQRKDFYAKLARNQTIHELLTRADFATVTMAESRFIENLLPVVDFWWQKMVGNKSISREILTSHWCTTFLCSFSASLVKKESLVRMSFLAPGSFDHLLRNWLTLAFPLLDALSPEFAHTSPFSDGELTPFHDFAWLSSCLMLPIFDGVRPGEGYSSVIGSFVGDIPQFLTRLVSHNSFKSQLATFTKESFGKALDLIILLGAINFAEWKDVVFKKQKDGSENADYKALTEPDAHAKLSRLLTKTSHLFGDENNPRNQSFLLDHVSLFVYTTMVTELLIPDMNKFDKSDIVFLVDNFQLTPYACWVATSPKLLASLANCQPFCEAFLRTTTKHISAISDRLEKEGLDGKETVRISMDGISNLLVAAKSSYFAKFLYEECSSTLTGIAFQKDDFFDKTNPISIKFLARLLSNSDDLARLRWSQQQSGEFKNLALDLLDEIAIPAKKFKQKNYINTMKCFQEIVARKPPIVSLATLAKEDCLGSQLDNLVVLSGRVMQTPFDKKSWPYAEIASLFEAIVTEIVALGGGLFERQREVLQLISIELRNIASTSS